MADNRTTDPTGDSQVRDWDLYAILAVTHGLPSLWDDYAALLEFLTGRSGLTPMLAIAAKIESETWLLELHPQLGQISSPVGGWPDEDAMDAWADQQRARYGATLPIRPIPADRRDTRDPAQVAIDTAFDITGDDAPDKVWVADPSDPADTDRVIGDILRRDDQRNRETNDPRDDQD
jgi:hypothetical protein